MIKSVSEVDYTIIHGVVFNFKILSSSYLIKRNDLKENFHKAHASLYCKINDIQQ